MWDDPPLKANPHPWSPRRENLEPENERENACKQRCNMNRTFSHDVTAAMLVFQKKKEWRPWWCTKLILRGCARLRSEWSGFRHWPETLCCVLGQRHFTLKVPLSTQGPVVQKPINANPRLKFNQGVYFSSPKCWSMLIFGKTFTLEEVNL